MRCYLFPIHPAAASPPSWQPGVPCGASLSERPDHLTMLSVHLSGGLIAAMEQPIPEVQSSGSALRAWDYRAAQRLQPLAEDLDHQPGVRAEPNQAEALTAPALR